MQKTYKNALKTHQLKHLSIRGLAGCLITSQTIPNEHVYSHKAAQKKKKHHKNSNIKPSLHIHQTSGTPNQQLNTAAWMHNETLFVNFVVLVINGENVDWVRNNRLPIVRTCSRNNEVSAMLTPRSRWPSAVTHSWRSCCSAPAARTCWTCETR